jgi:hypothetical protein
MKLWRKFQSSKKKGAPKRSGNHRDHRNPVSEVINGPNGTTVDSDRSGDQIGQYSNSIADSFSEIEDVMKVVNSRSAYAQLQALSDGNTSYGMLASLLSEEKFKKYDIASKVMVGKLRASGGFADVYEGKMLKNTIDNNTLGTSTSLCQYLQTNPPIFQKVAVKRFRIFVNQEGEFAKVGLSRLDHCALTCVVIQSIAREMRVWARLDHPNVLCLLGFTLLGDLPCLVSEWMENGTVRQFTAAKPTSLNMMVRAPSLHYS